MKTVLEDDETEAILLVDASNAFNSLNRRTALLNIQNRCPAIATTLVNCYREETPLFVGGEKIMSKEGITQGDPMAMALYALATTPLIEDLEMSSVTQIWFTDDASAGGKLESLRKWWDSLVVKGSGFGYLPNAPKTCLIVKESYLERAAQWFNGTDIEITTEGHRHLGAALGDRVFTETFVINKIDEWTKQVKQLAEIANSEPLAAFSAFRHGMIAEWNFIMRTIPDIEALLLPLEETISTLLIPSLTGRPTPSSEERNLLSLPARMGGIGLIDPTKISTAQFSTSKKVTQPLTSDLLGKVKREYKAIEAEMMTLSREQKQEKQKVNEVEVDRIKSLLPKDLQFAMDLASEKGASTWLSALPLEEYGFFLHKGDFRDAISLRYGWKPKGLPMHCVCGKAFSVEHATSCSSGALPTLRHNDIRDLTIELMTETCHNVAVEPKLQPITGEAFRYRSTNIEEEARLDIKANGFWGSKSSCAFFDVRVFNPYAQSNRNKSLKACYRKHEQEKRRAYEGRILQVEHGSFCPIVLSTTGGMGPTTQVIYGRLASEISKKRSVNYSQSEVD